MKMKPHQYTEWQQRFVLALESEHTCIEPESLPSLGLLEYPQALGMTETAYATLLKRHIKSLIKAGLIYDSATNALGTFYSLTEAGVQLRRYLLAEFISSTFS
jgi:hypothetical protein